MAESTLDPTPPPAPPDPPDPPAPPTDDEPLGESGEKALKAWKERAKAAESAAKRVEALEAENAALKQQTMTDQEKAIDAARTEAAAAARAEVLGSANARLFTAELRAATASKLLPAATQDLLVDSTVALKLLGLNEVPVTADGDVDSAAIAQAVDAYVASRPHLAASATQTPGPIDQGARSTPAAKTLDAQIAEAEAAGNWKLSGRLKTQKMLAQ